MALSSSSSKQHQNSGCNATQLGQPQENGLGPEVNDLPIGTVIALDHPILINRIAKYILPFDWSS